MKQSLGAALLTVILLTLAACSAPEQAPPGPPAATLAPVSSVRGIIPGEANRYGVLHFAAVYSESDVIFAQPNYPVEFDETGAFSVLLPATVASGFAGYGDCPFAGHAAVGLITALAAPAVDGHSPRGTLRGSYRLEVGGVLTMFWYSPEQTRITCVNAERGNMTGGLVEEWNLVLGEGWNRVLAYEGEQATAFRTGAARGAEWREWLPD